MPQPEIDLPIRNKPLRQRGLVIAEIFAPPATLPIHIQSASHEDGYVTTRIQVAVALVPIRQPELK